MGSLFSSKKEQKPLGEKVNVYDLQALKHKMDDEVKKSLGSMGFEEDFVLSNWRIVLGFLIVSLAVYSYWCTDRLIIGVICGIYLSVNGIFQYIQWYIQRNSFFLSKTNEEGMSVRLSSKLKESFSLEYILTMDFVDGTQSYWKRLGSSHPFRSEKQICLLNEYFDPEGYIDEMKVGNEISNMLERCQNKKRK